jgi:enterochelin esterase-like enzyme
MRPNSVSALIFVLVLGVVAAVGLGWMWNRVRSWWGWFDRVVAVLLCAGLSLAAAGIAVNLELNLYTTWGQVLGQKAAAPAKGQPQTVSEGAGGSKVVEFSLSGRASGISLPAYAYLPPGYDAAKNQRTRYPVIEAVDGFPGSPNTWLVSLKAGEYLDNEIANGRMAPTVVIFPFQVTDPTRDSECVNAVGGAQFDTYLTTDLQQAVAEQFRVRTDRMGWSIIGTSTGGFCAVNLAMRHVDRYAAAASLSGYFTAITDSTTGDLYKGNTHLRDENSPTWRVRNLPNPPLPLYVATAADDKQGLAQLKDFTGSVKPPIALTKIIVPQGGHTGAVWRILLPSAFDWLSGWMLAPQVDATPGPAVLGPTHGPVTQRIQPCPVRPPVRPGAAAAPACVPPKR